MTDVADTKSAESPSSPEANTTENTSDQSLQAETPTEANGHEAADTAEVATEAASAEPAAEAPASEATAEPPAAEASAATPSEAPPSAEAATPQAEAPDAPKKADAPEKAEAAGKAEAPEKAEAAGKAEATAEVATAEADASKEAEAAEKDDGTIKPEFAHLVATMESKSVLKGTVIGWNKGGFHISLDGITAFCPKSQIEAGNPKKAGNYLNRELDFRVIEIKEGGKRIVVSRTEILSQQRNETLAMLREKLKTGEPIKGKVTSITDFGAFVDLGGLEGLIHLSALSRRRVDNPREVVAAGQEVEVKVTKIEKKGERISLSRKALEPDPWKGVEDRYEVGEKFTGKILRKAEFGLFVELEPGLEGLIHNSQLPHGTKEEDDSLAVGKDVEVWVRDADGAKRRLSLSMREVAKGNFKELISKYEEGMEVNGVIEQVARFGLFVQLEPGLTGLLPFSTMPGQGSGPPSQRTHRPGAEIKLQIAEIDAKRKRISLAPLGTQLAGTKADLQAYQQKAEETTTAAGMGAMAAAFAKLQKNG